MWYTFGAFTREPILSKGSKMNAKKIIIAIIFVSTVFFPSSNSFAARRPQLTLKPEAVVSYVDFNASGISPLQPSTDRVFYKILNISNKAVLQTVQIYTGVTVEKSMVMEQRNKMLHFSLIDLGGTANPVHNTLTYITVDQSGSIASEVVPQPSSWANRMIRRVKIALWENGNTTIPIILAQTFDIPTAASGPSHQLDVLAKINGVWQSALVQGNLIGMETMALHVDSTTDTAYIAFPEGAPNNTYTERCITWNNVSHPVNWAFSVTANITNLNIVGVSGFLKIARNNLSNPVLAFPIVDPQISGGLGIILHDTQNQNQQIAAQAAIMQDLFEFAPGLLGFLVKNYQSGPTFLSEDFLLYLDGTGIISSFHL